MAINDNGVLVERQYIGARYVIKIYENSTDPSSAEWEQGNFEPLIMVTYQFGSYLSKKQVPASVGNPADNPTYWVQTGFYNGQIASLQSQIDAINANIDIIESKIAGVSDRKYIFVGDSYGDETYLPDVQGWWRYLADYLGLSSSDYYECCVNGGGFNRTDTSKRYISILQAIESNVTDKGSITDILVAGGYNDIEETPSDILTRAQELKTYIQQTYPNAKIWIAPIGWTSNITYARINLFRRMISSYLSLATIGFSPIDKGYLALHDYSNFRDVAHPTSAGNAEIAKFLYAGLINCNYCYVINQLQQTITPSTGVTFIGSPLFNANLDDRNITVFTGLQAQLATPTSVVADGSTRIPIGTLSDGIVKGSADANIPISINGNYDDGTNYHSVDLNLYLEDGVLSVSPVVWDGRGYATITINRIGYPRTQLTLDALNC